MAVSIKEVAKNLPVMRGFVHKVPPYLTGSVIENQLGLQVLRMIGKQISWQFRSRQTDAEIQEYVEVLDRDGVLVIPDFLTAEQFSRVQQECNAIESGMSFEAFRKINYGKIQVANFDLKEEHNNYSAIKNYLQENPMILKTASAIIKRRIEDRPSVRISIYRKVSETAPDNDVENVLHADLHTPTVKAFFYLNDIDESNGAFVYVKGSHRMSVNRLRHEYNLSVHTAKLNRGDAIPQHLLVERGPIKRVTVSDKHLGNLEETPICGKANTLVIANNMGFHRRGVFSSEKVRKTLIVNFRNFEKCF